MFSFVKVSRLRRPIQEISIMVRNSSHFTYAPDPPVENMGKVYRRHKDLQQKINVTRP